MPAASPRSIAWREFICSDRYNRPGNGFLLSRAGAMEGWRRIVRYVNYRLHMTGLDVCIGMFPGTGGIHVGILQPEEKVCH